MGQRAAPPRRSPVEWAFRATLAAAAGALGYSAVAHSLAYSLRENAVERAQTLASDDGSITALLSEKLSGATATAADRVRADELARKALLQDPTAVAAVATLGINAQLRGDNTSARRLFAYSDKLSRRDLRTRLWAIEDAVSRDDVPGALRQYDIALRTTRNAPDVLFPLLAGAITDPTIRAGLVRTLVTRPPWMNQFIAFVSGKGEPRAVTRLFLDLQRAGIAISDAPSSTAINGLIAGGFVDEAWAYYASQRTNVARSQSRDPQFTADRDTPSFLDWMPGAGDSGISASIQPSKQGGLFDFAAPTGASGTLLQQMQLLPPGDYILEGHSIGIDQTADSRPYWTLKCPDGRELGRLPVSNSSETSGHFKGRFTVPSGCPTQFLMLVARPSLNVSGVTGQIDRALLKPAK